jgi:hypothetical protein
MRGFVRLFVWLIATTAAWPVPAADRPNILWIVVDDMSADFGCYGSTSVPTPHVDRLAAEGTRFTRVFVTAPDAATAAARAARALDVALADHAVDPGAAGITISCTTPTDCLDRRGFVTVTVDVLVPLPLLPAVLPGGLPLAVPVQAAATQQVSRFGGAG